MFFFSCWAVFLALYHDSQLSKWNNLSLLSWYTYRSNSNFEMHLMQLRALFFIHAFYSWRTFELHPVTGSWLLCSGHHCKHFFFKLMWALSSYVFQSIRAPDRHARELVAAAQCSQMRAVFAEACSVAWPTSPQPSAGRHLLCLPFGFVLDWQTVTTCCYLGATRIVKACTQKRKPCLLFLPVFRAVVPSCGAGPLPQQKTTGKHGYLHYDS